LSYGIKKKINIYVSVKHNSILLFNLMATSFGHQTIITQNLISHRLHAAHINFMSYGIAKKFFINVKNLLQP